MMATRTSDHPPDPVTMYAFVGKIGCIRLPNPIRTVSGIKRGDRLALTVLAPDTIRLARLDLPVLSPRAATADTRVEGYTWLEPNVATVGWSYIQLSKSLACELGFLPDSLVKLVGAPAQVLVSLHRDLQNPEGVPDVDPSWLIYVKTLRYRLP